MESNEFLFLIKRKKGTILSWVILFLALAIIFTAAQPFKYSAKSKALVVQQYDGIVDPYAASKSNEYLSNILANVVTSESFFQEVINSGYHINQSYFPERSDKRLKEWNRTVDARAMNDTGIIAINVFHKDKYQTEQIAAAVNYILKTKNGLYHGAGDKVNVKIINPPIVSHWPVKPNIALNLFLSLALGLIFGLSYIYLLPEERYNMRLWPTFVPQHRGTTAGKPASAFAFAEAERDRDDSNKAIEQELEQAETEVEEEHEKRDEIIGSDIETENDSDADRLSYEDIIKNASIKNILDGRQSE